MNPMTPKRTRRLRARAATMHAAEEYEDYGPEPNMKLSHAFMVVLLLHVIAVVGLYAFNSMKAGKVSASKVAKTMPSVPSGPSQEPSANPDPSPGGSDSDGKPTSGDKSAMVAKLSEATKATKGDAIKAASTQGEGSGKGLVASARGALQKAAGLVTSAAGASKAAAQGTAPEATNTTATSEPVPSATASEKTYMVRAGDTMTRIASSLGVAIPDLEKVNGLSGNAILQVGQILKVPEHVITQAAGDAAADTAKLSGGGRDPIPTNASNAVAVPPAVGSVSMYTVVKGDNPYKIAKKFKISPEEVMKANGITDPKKIQIGQQLKVPAPTGKGAK
jgi:LysM repeat protein